MKKCIIRRYFSLVSASTLYLALGTCAVAAAVDRDPLVIKDQGSLIAGGTVITQPGAEGNPARSGSSS
jgi:hypothetical protein